MPSQTRIRDSIWLITCSYRPNYCINSRAKQTASAIQRSGWSWGQSEAAKLSSLASLTCILKIQHLSLKQQPSTTTKARLGLTQDTARCIVKLRFTPWQSALASLSTKSRSRTTTQWDQWLRSTTSLSERLAQEEYSIVSRRIGDRMLLDR